MLKKLEKIFKYFIIAGAGFLLTFILVLTWALKNPKTVWAWSERYILPKDMHITWSDIELSVKHLSGYDFYFDWTVDQLHVVKLSPALDIPIEHLRIEGSVFPKSVGPKLVVHQFVVTAPEILHFRPNPSSLSQPEKNPFQTLQDYIHYIEVFQKYAQLENVDVSVNEFRLEENADQYTPIELQLSQNEKDDQPKQIDFDIHTNFSKASIFTFSATGGMILPTGADTNLWMMSQVFFAGWDIESTETLDLNYSDQKTTLAITGLIRYKNKKVLLKSDLEAYLTMGMKAADLDLKAKISGLPGSMVKVNSLQAELHSPFEKNQTLSSNFSSFKVQVPIQLFFIDPDMAKPLAKSCQCKIPEVIQAELSGKVWLSHLTQKSPEKLPVLDAEIKIEDVDNKLLKLTAAGRVEIFRQNSQYEINPMIDMTARINSFQGFRQFLDAKSILIPAPLNVLDGQIQFSMKGPVVSTLDAYVLPATATAALTSNRQVVDLQTTAKITFNKNLKAADVQVELLVNQLQLELPPLDPIKGKPRIFPDQRILKKQVVKKPSQFKMTVSFNAKTAKLGSVKLLSSYFAPFLPLSFNFHQGTGEKNAGLIQIEAFDVNYVRRTVRVQKMKISLPDKNSQFFEVDGRLQIKQTQYTIFIDIKGPSNAPHISLSSEPYLPRSEIISVLIYDRTSDELVSSDAKTAGNVEAAIVDRAVGLLGIWAFASTPIKGFSYNPVTKVYTATVAVSDDVTASVGTNWEAATQVELRKKVARQWMLTAAWTPAGRDQEEVTSLVLQWENRF